MYLGSYPLPHPLIADMLLHILALDLGEEIVVEDENEAPTFL